MPNNTSRRSVESTSSTSTVSRKSLIDVLAIWINKKLDIEERLSPQVLRKVLWFAMLAAIYIWVQHRYDNSIRRLEKADVQLQESRASYIFYKSKYLFASKQSEISKKLEAEGYQQNSNAPYKIAAE